MPDGQPMKTVDSAMYLGTLVNNKGDTKMTLTYRIGEAYKTFDNLKSVWKHANLPVLRKLIIFKACVVSKLLYSLEVTCTRQADNTRIDAFYTKCLRQVLSIPHPMVSHVSNVEVLSRAGEIRLSLQLLKAQMLFYGRVANMSDTSIQRALSLNSSTACPKQFVGKRKVGRPRLTWSNLIYAHSMAAAGNDQAALHDMVCSVEPHMQTWRAAIADYINSIS